MDKERIYVVGDRGAGVLIIRTNPLRVAEISDDEINKYSDTTGSDGYAKVAASLWRFVTDYRAGKGDGHSGGVDLVKAHGVESLVEAGVQLTEVDFAFAAGFGTGAARAHATVQATNQATNQATSNGPSRVRAQATSQPPPPVKGQATSEPPPPVRGQATSEPPPPVRGQATSEPPPPVRGQATSEPPPPVKGQATSEPPPPVKGQATSEAPPPPVNAQATGDNPALASVQATIQATIEAHATIYTPIEAALRHLIGTDGDNLMIAVLSDIPSR